MSTKTTKNDEADFFQFFPEVEIPKPGGGKRLLGIPMVVDRLIGRVGKRTGETWTQLLPLCGNIYVHSQRAGGRVMASIARFLEKRFRLKLNEKKSGVERPRKSSFLGYSMTSNREPKLKAAPSSVKRLKDKLKVSFRPGRGRNLKKTIEDMTPLLRGWINYYSLCEVKRVFEELDEARTLRKASNSL